MIRRISANTLYLLFGQYINRLLLLFFYVVLTRNLDETTVGEYAIATTYVGFVFILVSFGIDRFTLRELSRQPGDARKLYNAALQVLLLLWLFTLPIAATLPWFLRYNAQITYAIWILMAWVLVSALQLILGATFQSIERMSFSSLLDVLSAGQLLIYGVLALWLTHSLYGVVIAMVLERLMTTMVGIFLARRHLFSVDLSPSSTTYTAAGVLRSSLPFAAFGLLAATYQRIDVLLMPYYVSTAEIGQYATAYRIFEATLILPATIATAVFPLLARAIKDDFALYQQVAGQAIQNSLALAGLTIGILFMLATPIITTIFGEEYRFAATLFSVLIWGLLLQSINNTLGRCIIAANLDRYFAGLAAVALTSNILLNLWLLPRLGAMGAALATLGSYGVSTLAHLYIVQRNQVLPKWGKIPYIIVTFLVAGLSIETAELFSTAYVSIVIGTVVYIILLFAFQVVSVKPLMSKYRGVN